MFTGLVEATVPVTRLSPRGAGAVLVLPAPGTARSSWEVAPGDSIACAGCCLTVADLGPDGAMTFELSGETLARTWLPGARPGRLVNLERSLALGDRLGGHLVSGHVDGVGSIVAIEDPGDGGRVFRFEGPPGFERWLVDKGSISVDGISLTVVAPEECRFDVWVIPETLARTNFGTAEVGQQVHLEIDLVAKWIEHLVAPYLGGRGLG